MLRRKRAEIHVNQERWLVSYADFITLLFAFFVVMYSISQVNQSKYRVLSDTFVQAFAAPIQFSTDANQVTAVPIDSTLNPIQVGDPTRSPATTAIDLHSNLTGTLDSPVRDELAEISDLFAERFGDLIDDQLVRVASNELWLQIELKDSILFGSGTADPSLQAQAIFDEIAQVLKDYPNPVQVEGYTDNVPINSPRYPSNWELSAARASAIVKWLASRGVAPERLSAVGFGEFQPVADNSSSEGRAQNRRVVLMIARKNLPRPGFPLAENPLGVNPSGINPPASSSASAPATAAEPAVESRTGEVASQPDVTAASSSSTSAAGVGENESGVTPIELDDGGLLFTSDPELPRSSR